MKQREIFIQALQKPDNDERSAFLDSACENKPGLRNEIEALLAEHREDKSFFLDSPPAGIGTVALDLEDIEWTGKQIGPYKLLEILGEGGMGTVYMASQAEPIRRRVAVKVIKTGMDTRQVIARFEAERQTLALMDHPNISKVLDAGSTESGRPYFVMELVKGIPITKFCDQQQIGLQQRLGLFQQVCHGVQHAHQKGIIHRDLKPSNVLVAMYDDRPVVKVIDFGVAKATSEQLTEKTMFTRFGQIVGTLEYMSPEQAQFNQLDIDTRSDVYSLGAILCELISGEPPFNKKRMKSQALDETLRMIREEEPTKPSTKLSSSAQLAQVASNRNTSAERLSSQLRGDLDWIVMKALDKDRARRFETASGLALDLEHYLADEPVTATPPSTKYRLRKFARRNKIALAFVSTIGIGFLAAIIGLSISNRMISQRENEKQDAVQNAEQNNQRAQNAVDNYLLKVSEERLLNTPGMQPLRKELLELALQYYKEFIDQQPGNVAAQSDLALAFHRIGSIKRELGEHQNAIEAQLRCIELLNNIIVRHGGGSNLELQADAYDDLSGSYSSLMNMKKATEYHRKEIQVREEIVNLEPDSQHKKYKLARCYMGISNILIPDFGEATRYSDQAIAIAENLILLDEADPDNQFLMGLVASNRATLLAKQGMLEGAFNWYQSSINHLETSVEEDPENLKYQQILAVTFQNRGSTYGQSNQIENALDDLLAAIEFQSH